MRRHDQEPGPGNLAADAQAAGVTDRRVLEAIGRVPRTAFVRVTYITRAYDDAPIPIPCHRVTTQPSLSAAMIAALVTAARNSIAHEIRGAKVPVAREHRLWAAGVRQGDRGGEG